MRGPQASLKSIMGGFQLHQKKIPEGVYYLQIGPINIDSKLKSMNEGTGLIQVKEEEWMGFFLWLAGLLLGISLGLRPPEIPRSSPASPWKNPSIPPLLLGLTQSPHSCSSTLSLYLLGQFGDNKPLRGFFF